MRWIEPSSSRRWTDRRAETPTGQGRHTDRHHETTRPGLRTDKLTAGAGDRQGKAGKRWRDTDTDTNTDADTDTGQARQGDTAWVII